MTHLETVFLSRTQAIGEMSKGAQTEAINKAAKNGLENSQNGLHLAEKAGSSMQAISQASKAANSSFKILEQRSGEITRVLTVITDIASQTNLLALNAAIEAAQAGGCRQSFFRSGR